MSAYDVHKEMLRKAEDYYLEHVDEIEKEKKRLRAARYYAKHANQIKVKVKAYKHAKLVERLINLPFEGAL